MVSSVWEHAGVSIRLTPENAFLVVELNISGRQSAGSTEPRGVLYVMRVPGEKSRPIAATHSKGNLFLFSNISPGRYRLYEMVISESGPVVQDKFGRMRALQSTVITWKGEAAETSVTEALAGVVSYMGAYSARIRSRSVSKVAGLKERAGEERALRGILKNWSGDWPRQVRLQMAGL